jgi:processive 1,2-diacylglycerol beta-glucosyltransferase
MHVASTDSSISRSTLIELAGAAGDSTRVLLLTSGLGCGHVRAAQAIEAAFPRHVEVANIDLWSLMNPGVARACQETYLELVIDHPDLYERLYRLDEHTWRQILESESGPPRPVLEVLQLISVIAEAAVPSIPRGGRYASDRMLLSLLCAALPYDADSLAGNGVRARLAVMKWVWQRLIRRLEPAVREFAPDAIISTQMIPAAMVSYLKHRGKVDAPMIGVVTDFGVHDFWRQPGVDAYCVAHESIAASLAETCTHADVEATGVPLMPDFAAVMSQGEARRELDLPQHGPIALVLGGGLGLSVDQAAQLLVKGTDLCVVAMAGRNETVYGRLAALGAGAAGRLRTYQWTDRMDLFFRAADLIVGKPGGVSMAEALACGRPLLATRSLNGQEGFNVRFLEQHDVGGLVADGELLPRVQALVRDRERLLDMQRRAWLLGHREGAARVVELTLDLASAYRGDAIAAQS